jgi:hypothetical protein
MMLRRFCLSVFAGMLWSTCSVGAETSAVSDLEQITVYAPQPNGTSLEPK